MIIMDYAWPLLIYASFYNNKGNWFATHGNVASRGHVLQFALPEQN